MTGNRQLYRIDGIPDGMIKVFPKSCLAAIDYFKSIAQPTFSVGDVQSPKSKQCIKTVSNGQPVTQPVVEPIGKKDGDKI